jgi:hypothetical protein
LRDVYCHRDYDAKKSRRITVTERLVGIQVGAASFVDEGIPAVLDTVQERAGVNTLFLATPTWNRATGGRAEPGYVYAGHGSREYDKDWAGGNYATVHPEYYGNTVLGPVGRASEHPDWDMLEQVIPIAGQRGMRSFALMDESSHARQLRSYPKFLQCLEVDIWNKPARRPCFNNPDYRNWHLSLIEDYIKNYDLDGIMWSSERPGPLDRLIQEPTRQGLGLVTCYCSYCKILGAERGISWRRSQEGYRKLVTWNADIARGQIPSDGAFVTFWRLLLTYPELLSWQSLWADGQHQMYRDIFGTVRAFRPDIKVGWNLYHNMSFSPFYRAGQNYSDLSHIADFLKISTYHSCAGPRFHTWIAGICRAIFGDADPEHVYPVMLKLLGLDEGVYAELPRTGFSADYVRREIQRARAGGEGRCVIYAGIDVDIPVGQPDIVGGPAISPGDSSAINADVTTGTELIKTTPERVKSAILAAFEGGASGIVLGEKYSQMQLSNLSGAGAALAELNYARESGTAA